MVLLLRRSIFCALILLLPLASRSQQYVVDTLVASPGMAFPVSLAFSPDNSGKFFFTEKNTGRVRVYDHGVLFPRPFATVPVRGSGEQGLLGITIHPDYPDSPFVYIFFTRSNDGSNIVARYRDSSGLGIRPVTILVNPHTAPNHNGGNIHFGPDRKLYVTLGDNGLPENAQDSSAQNLHGKILRLNPDGSIPHDNPWPGKPFWSIGHCNSFDFTFDPHTGKMYATENGSGLHEALFLVPRGGNLGWPDNFSRHTGVPLNNPEYVEPIHRFARPSVSFGRPGPTLPALTGVVVYRASAFPRLWGKILVAGNSTPAVWTLTLTEDGETVSDSLSALFAHSAGFADIEIGPDGFVYLTSANRILRIRPVAPSFTSVARTAATQGVLYTYTPTFDGTPPSLGLVHSPDGMQMDSTFTLRWTPTNQQALQHVQTVRLRAENGAGFVDQEFSIGVTNVNDPPGPFALVSPPGDTALSFVGSDPVVRFAWEPAHDPDLDSVAYTVETDTLPTFSSRALRDTAVGTGTSAMLVLPRRSANYYWRVKATDGLLSAASWESRRVVVSFTKAVQEEKVATVESRLEQNFPNPFNPTTSIVYTIPQAGPVHLAVFNLLGQEVALIFEGYQSEGTHEVEFKNSELPSGIYFYRIQATNFVETRKLTILR